MDSYSKTRTLGTRLTVLVGAAVCAAGFMVAGAGSADAASCGDAMVDKIGKQDVVVQSCPKGKQVVYTVTCGFGGGNSTKTASAYFNAFESRITEIDCGRGLNATDVDWEYA